MGSDVPGEHQPKWWRGSNSAEELWVQKWEKHQLAQRGHCLCVASHEPETCSLHA